jgi:hypothetical protein
MKISLQRLSAAALALTMLGLGVPAAAHNIPVDVAVQSYVKPEGHTLYLLVRVPLQAMRDMDVPIHPDQSIDVSRVTPALRDAAQVWIAESVQVYENGAQLGRGRIAAVQLSLPSDRSFTSWERARAHVTGPPLSSDDKLYWGQTLLDVLLEYPIHDDHADFSIHPDFSRLAEHVVTVLRFLPPGHGVRAFEYSGDPGLVRLDPHWYQAAKQFVGLGFLHILSGADHLLFLFCLVIPFRKLRALIPIITSFTVAHSMTLAASAYGLAPDFLWFPPLIEMLIALSIVYMALENIVGAQLHRRWLITFGFGLVHGFGFSFALRETLQFAGSHLLTSLLAFNTGVELGQLLVLVLLIPILDLLFRFVVAERMGTIILSAFVAHTGWHWMLDRANVLGAYHFQWPALTAAVLARAMSWLMLLVVMLAMVWGLWRLFRLLPGAEGPGKKSAA